MSRLFDCLKDITPDQTAGAVFDLGVNSSFNVTRAAKATDSGNQFPGLAELVASVSEGFGERLSPHDRQLLEAGASLAVEVLKRCAEVELTSAQDATVSS